MLKTPFSFMAFLLPPRIRSNLFVLFLACLIAVSLFADPAKADMPAVLPDASILRADVEQEMDFPKSKEPFSIKGRMVMAKGEGLIWHSTSPAPFTFVIAGNHFAQFIGGVLLSRNELKNKKRDTLSIEMSMFEDCMLGDWDAFKPKYNVYRVSDGKSFQVRIEPTEEQKTHTPFNSILVTGSTYVEKVVFAEKSGFKMAITFKNHKVSENDLTEEEQILFSETRKPVVTKDEIP